MTSSTPPDPRPASKDPDPRALVARVIAGDAAAIERWFRGEHPVVWRLCLGFLAAPAEADDAAQDAMLHLLDRLPAWDSTRAFAPWRNSLVLNLCRDRARRQARRRRHEEFAATTRRERTLPDPADVLQEREVRAVLADTLAALPPREREAFVLRDLEGLATEDVADAMEITASSVRSLLTLARRRLRGLLGARLDPAQGVSDA